MTFDYTQAQLVVALPDLRLKAPAGHVDGVLPILLRLDWNDAKHLHGLARDSSTREQLGSLLSHHRREVAAFWPNLPGQAEVVDSEEENPFPRDSDAAERWLDAKSTPTQADIEDLVTRLRDFDWLPGLRDRDAQLRQWLDLLAERAAGQVDATSTLVPLAVGLEIRWDDKGRLRLAAQGFEDPYARARMEAMSAYTEGRPGLVQCDVCERWFVPVRAGRPARRCPGFECGDIAKDRYQLSPERREYRRLSMRLTRAKSSGNAEAISAAEAELTSFKNRQETP